MFFFIIFVQACKTKKCSLLKCDTLSVCSSTVCVVHVLVVIASCLETNNLIDFVNIFISIILSEYVRKCSMVSVAKLSYLQAVCSSSDSEVLALNIIIPHRHPPSTFTSLSSWAAWLASHCLWVWSLPTTLRTREQLSSLWTSAGGECPGWLRESRGQGVQMWPWCWCVSQGHITVLDDSEADFRDCCKATEGYWASRITMLYFSGRSQGMVTLGHVLPQNNGNINDWSEKAVQEVSMIVYEVLCIVSL